MDLTENIQTLKQFVERADKLESLSFTKHVIAKPPSIKFEFNQEAFTIIRSGPDRESIDAFVLTLRFFIQNNEPISIKNMAALFKQLPLPEEDLIKISEGHAKLNTFLDSDVYFQLKSERPTHRAVLEAFVYGDLAHSTQRTAFEAAQKEPFLIFNSIFDSVLLELLRYIFWLRSCCKYAIKRLDGSK
ncbi:MAG: hypothetical protein ACKVRP_08255 [Bacteroidota bacterium]